MAIAVDTNVLVYAERLDDEARELRAHAVLGAVTSDLLVPAQVLGELYRVLTRKARLAAEEAAKAVGRWSALMEVIGTSPDAFEDAVTLSLRHGFDIWDSVIVSVAAKAKCALLLSEDMQDGFVWRGLTIVDPFASVPHPLLASALGGAKL